MNRITWTRTVLAPVICAGIATAAGAADGSPYDICRVGLDAAEPAIFGVCLEGFALDDEAELRRARERLAVTRQFVDLIQAQGDTRRAPEACAQSRVTLADLEAEIVRLRALSSAASGIRTRWIDARDQMQQAAGAGTFSQTGAMIILAQGRAQKIADEAAALEPHLRAPADYLVGVDPAGLCVGQPPPRSAPPEGVVSTPRTTVAARGYTVTGAGSATVENNGPRLTLVVHYSGEPAFPVTLSLKPRPSGCFDGTPPPGWSCGTVTHQAVAPARPGELEMPGALWCATNNEAHKGARTMKYVVESTDARGTKGGAAALDITCIVR